MLFRVAAWQNGARAWLGNATDCGQLRPVSLGPGSVLPSGEKIKPRPAEDDGGRFFLAHQKGTHIFDYAAASFGPPMLQEPLRLVGWHGRLVSWCPGRPGCLSLMSPRCRKPRGVMSHDHMRCIPMLVTPRAFGGGGWGSLRCARGRRRRGGARRPVSHLSTSREVSPLILLPSSHRRGSGCRRASGRMHADFIHRPNQGHGRRRPTWRLRLW